MLSAWGWWKFLNKPGAHFLHRAVHIFVAKLSLWRSSTFELHHEVRVFQIFPKPASAFGFHFPARAGRMRVPI
jgi:hypothetical protein